MKSRRIISILGIALILTLLFVILPAAPVFAVNSLAITPTQGAVGTSIAAHGELDANYNERWARLIVSGSDLAVGANMSSAPSYGIVISAVTVPTADQLNAGKFDCTFPIPTTLTDGTVNATVAPGQYYVYVTYTLPTSVQSLIAAKASLLVTAPPVPTLNALSPASGPGGTSVVISGSNYPVSTTLSFLFDGTTNLTPSAGDSATRATGLFSTTISIPLTASTGAHTISVTAGAVTCNATFTVTSTALLSLNPITGAAGAAVTLTGTGFTANMPLTIRFDTTIISPTSGNTATGITGGFTSVITVPSTATAGAHTITATAGGSQDTKTFTVTGTGALALTINPNNGPVGQSVSITSSGFVAGQIVTIVWNGVTTNTTALVDGLGVFLCTYIIPPTIHGPHILSAVGGTTTANATFTVESTPPPTPQPLRPYMDEAVSAPITLDWEDVTDNSSPVTYSVQISTSANFTTDSIIINRTGITTSQYILTDDDMLKVTTGVTYYWRECAVDAAQNQSVWTGTNSFSITQGFSFSGWILWVTIGVGAVLLFLFGIWIGRKTAYSY